MKKQEGDTQFKYEICLTRDKYYAMYTKKLAKHKKDICIQPIHGGTWLYSMKDPGSGMENVVIATNDPELLFFHPELGNNEIFNDYVRNCIQKNHHEKNITKIKDFNKKIKQDIRKESKIGYNDPNPDPNCGATTAEFMMVLGKKVDKALDIHNNIKKIINKK